MDTPSDRKIVITRVFDAPRRLVFEALTRPEHVRQWWGPAYLSVPVCEFDLRVGGAYRFVNCAADGQEYGFSGVYREIVRPERPAYTYVFEAMPDHGSLITVILEEHDGRTTMTETILHPSVEDRDGHVQSGMEAGMAESLDRLAALLRTMD